MKLIVTGGAGFIGSHFVEWLVKHPADQVTTLDKLTYAGNLDNLAEVLKSPRHRFVRGDIGHAPTVKRLARGGRRGQLRGGNPCGPFPFGRQSLFADECARHLHPGQRRPRGGGAAVCSCLDGRGVWFCYKREIPGRAIRN